MLEFAGATPDHKMDFFLSKRSEAENKNAATSVYVEATRNQEIALEAYSLWDIFSFNLRISVPKFFFHISS